jgi:hypothetical protein
VCKLAFGAWQLNYSNLVSECQGGVFAPTGTYSPMFNDIWSLAIILLNLATGRNPWKSASASDPTFQAYLRDPMGFLPTVLPISNEINAILVRMLEVDWRDRMTLPELRQAIEEVDSFYSDGVIFEGSMARCPWEAGMDIDSASSSKESVPRPASSQSDLKSHWSNDSLSDSDIAFNSQSADHESSYGHWSEYASCAPTWGFESPASSSRGFANLKMYDAPRTPPSTRSSLSSSGSQSGSLPTTPNSMDMTFAGKMDVSSKVLTVNTERCNPRYYNERMTSCSTDSSMMQTAIEYDPYSSSFFLASPPLKSLAIPSTVDLGKSPPGEDREMDGVSSWNYSATDLSLRSMYSRTSRIDCDADAEHEDPDTIVWPEFRTQPITVPQPRHASLNFPSFSTSRPALSPSKKSGETRSIGSSLFRFFPRSPPSSSSSARGPAYADSSVSRTPSPSPSAWTSPRAAVSSQDGGWRRRAKVPTRHWFSPGKLFSGIGA